MVTKDQRGGMSVVLAVVFGLLLIAALVFGTWAFGSRQDYKNNVDSKITTAVNSAVAHEDTIKDAQFAQQEKNPLTTYNGPEAYGSIAVQYPKTWSGYVDSTGTGNALVDGYFNPGVVPSITSQSSIFALRVQVLSQSYSQVLQNFTGQEQDGKLTASVFALKLVPKAVGVEVSGDLGEANQSSVTMVVLPLRSETLEIWTEGNTNLSDFNNIILPNFSFSP